MRDFTTTTHDDNAADYTITLASQDAGVVAMVYRGEEPIYMRINTRHDDALHRAIACAAEDHATLTPTTTPHVHVIDET